MPKSGGANQRGKYPTLKDVAKLANTTAATASYVLNNVKDRYITDELRQRVLDAARELHYSKSLVASGLKGKSRKMLTLLIPQLSNIFFARVALAIERHAFERGYIVHICNTFDDPEREKAIIEQSVSQRIDGLFISGTHLAYENTKAIRAYGIPYVAVERPLTCPKGSSEGYYFVGSNNYQSGQMGAEHLTANGHRNLCYIEWMRNITNVTSRRRGFEDVVKKTGCDCVIKSSQALGAENGYRLTKEVLESGNSPTAFLYGHHRLAEGGVACLRDKGLDVPRDVSVAIVGAAEWVEISRPRFTFVRQPADLIGETAAQILMGLIESEPEISAAPVQKMFDCELMLGDTVSNLNQQP